MYEKLAMVDHCCMVTPNHHLNDRLSFNIARERTTTTTTRNKRRPLMNGTATRVDNAYDAIHGSYVEDKLCKSTIVDPPFGDP